MLPSFSSWQPGRALRALWAALRPGERSRLLAYLVLPTLSRFALLAGFGVTMKAIFAVASEPLPPESLRLYGAAVLFVLLFAALMQHLQQRSLARLHYDMRGVARRIVGGGVARFGTTGDREGETSGNDDASRKKDRREACLAVERDLSKGAGAGLVTAVDLVAGFLLVSLILAAITLVLPAAGALVAAVGVAVLVFLKLRVRRPREKDGSQSISRRERREALDALLDGAGDESSLLRYEENGLDRAPERKRLAEKRRESRIAVFSNVVSAFVLAACLFLVARQDMREHDPVHLLLFIIALRLFAMQGRTLLKQWAEILRKKQFLHAFALILTGRDGIARLASKEASP